MTRYLLDRDVMSQLDQAEPRRHENVRAWFESILDSDLHVSAITVMEAWKGFAAARRKASERPEALRTCDRYEQAFGGLVAAFSDRVLPVDDRIARVWGEMLGRQDKNRFDACVAATALVHDMTVVTRNTRDFSGRGVRVVGRFGQRSESR